MKYYVTDRSIAHLTMKTVSQLGEVRIHPELGYMAVHETLPIQTVSGITDHLMVGEKLEDIIEEMQKTFWSVLGGVISRTLNDGMIGDVWEYDFPNMTIEDLRNETRKK